MTIRHRPGGGFYCDGRECGYPLTFQPCDPEEGADGEWVCLDCGSAMFAARPDPVQVALAAAGAQALAALKAASPSPPSAAEMAKTRFFPSRIPRSE